MTAEDQTSTTRAYVAADYVRKPEVAALCARLEALGIEPTSTWAMDGEPGEGAGGELEGEAAALAIKAANLDLGDIDRSSLFIQLTTGEKARGGRHVELGYALGLTLPVVVVGPREHVFHYHPEVTVLEDEKELMAWLRGYLRA